MFSSTKYDQFPYDRNDARAIFEYSTRILGHSLEEVSFTDISEFKGKGRLGNMVEKYFFQYEPNSDTNADFSEAGVELKCTPVKKIKGDRLVNKERLVCSMIDYDEDWKHSFKDSHIYRKCALMLVLFYLHQDSIPVQQLMFLFSVLWRLPEKDLLIIEQDYDIIMSKIRAGKADELSEGDTTYLGACRKGQAGEKDKTYTAEGGIIASAPKRAYSLKTSYMKTILDFVRESGKPYASNYTSISPQGLVSVEELKEKSFEDILLDRFKPFYGKTYSELCAALGVEESPSKSKYADIINLILTEKGKRGDNFNNSEEFVKSGIRVKTIRLRKNGMPKEAMSFPAIDYCSIVQEEWFDSALYGYFTQRFLFVVFNNVAISGEEYALEKAFFWTMPKGDLEEAYYYWKNIKENVLADNYRPNAFYTIREHKKFHVRPHAANKRDTALAPSGRLVDKYGYWFNADYVKSIIDKH